MKSNHGGLRSAAVLSLCGLFAVLAMGLALLASGVYREVSAAADENYLHRTALSFLVNQVHRADGSGGDALGMLTGGVAVGNFGGGDALIFSEQPLDGDHYVTLLYCYDGQLRELYTQEGSGLLPEDGTAILPAQALRLTVEGGQLTITVDLGEGGTHSVTLAPRHGVREVGAL